MIRKSLALRPYQEEMIVDVRGAMRRHKNVLLQAPTGSGKGFVVSWMMREAAAKDRRCWLVAHRKELIDQLSKELWKLGVPHGMIAAGRTMTKEPVQVCSIMTLVRRLDRLPPPSLLCVDEAHHAVANSYEKVLEHCARSWVVGLTATPCRTDGKGLDDHFDALVRGPEVADLIEAGYLAPYRVFMPPSAMDMDALSDVRTRAGDYARGELEAVVDQSAVVGDAVEHYRKYVQNSAAANGRPPSCLVYCVSRVHARHVEAAYRAQGIDARYCAGDTPKAEREAMVEGFRTGEPPVIVSVDLFGEGLDVPGLAAVQLLRPTQSLTLHLQQLGRALRPEPGKTALILDHVGNCLRHGLPDDPRDWTLEGTKSRRDAEDSGPALKNCEQCFAVFRAIEGACPLCGWKPTPETRGDQIPDEVEGELEEVDPAVLRRRRRREEAKADSLEDLVELALERSYKVAWAGIRHAVRQGHKPGSKAAKKYIGKAHKIAKSI